ncbi:MAG: bifunctional hydroxymethylpyrimidine kinase/phosphomethylpyrimidine kinase [Verrucomicrobiota bacterium]|jgi:hydroxymethylpyrimidine/phosphomethylpyrimidine kinase
MHKSNSPVALTIAGSDSGGEAGIQADLNTFACLKVHGVTAITCLTAQNPERISRLKPCPPSMVRAQLEAIAAHFTVAAAKTGMLFSAAIVREAALFFKRNPGIPLVVDPVMVSTSGRRLLKSDGIEALKKLLLPLAAIVTPNLPEAEILAGEKIRSIEQLRGAARTIYRRFGCAALVKGGHLTGTGEAVDFFHGREGEWMLSSPRAVNVTLHGTGCTYSAAITAWLALGRSRIGSVELAKKYITRRIYETGRPED